MPEAWVAHPSIARIAKLATALRDLNEHVVYIGGAIAPILQTEPPFSSARITKDVDGITAAGSYFAHAKVQRRLRELGFREDARGAHAHRWIAPDGILFDLVPAGVHLGATGKEWDEYAVRTAVVARIAARVTIRHASAPAFLALKLAAYRDRGAEDPVMSHDLEDIIALIASRPDMVGEVSAESRAFVRAVARELTRITSRPDFEDLLAGNLGHAFDPAGTIELTRARMTALAKLRG